MRYLFFALLFCLNLNAQFLKKTFKYATFYAAYSQNNSIQSDRTFYVTQDSKLIETTQETPADFIKTFGFRKLAFFGYEDRERFYDGNEQNNSIKSNIGNVTGLEYLFEIQQGRQQNKNFENKQLFVRYLAKYWLIKAEETKNTLVDIDYKSAEFRLRLPIGKKLSLSAGAIYRTYEKAYGHNPIESYLQDKQWWDLSYSYFNHSDMPYQWQSITTNETGIDYFWYDEDGNLLAQSDYDYRNRIYGELVNQYNKEQLDLIGGFAEVSSIIGLDFYHYRKSFWFHAYGNVLPHHKLVEGKEDCSYGNFVDGDNWIDYSFGGVFGVRINKHFGLFSEVTLQKYWDREIKVIKAGINIKL